ncbi:MAG: efflux RND transporter periplasmic adaptor subunit [Xanthomonadales bacterium]|nr:efflux RND transporter periplasmic adaptor subunit [Xanthomonadales bacterium]
MNVIIKYVGKYAGALILVFGLYGCGGDEAGDNQSKSGKNTITTMISVATAERAPLRYWIETVGVLESINSPKIAAEVSGKITKILVKSGESVQAGEVLLIVDSSNLKLQEKAAKAELKQLSVLIENEAKRVKRLSDLDKKNYVSKSGLDDARAKLAGYKAQSEAAKANLSLAQDQLARTEIKAPFDAKIDSRLVSVGDYLRPGTPVFTLAETDRLQARLPVPEVAGGKLKSGQLVEITIATDTDNLVTSKIREIQPVITAGARSLILLADVTAANNRYPGATVRARVLIGENPDAVLVPAISIVRRPVGDVVYLISGNWAEQQVVQRGQSRDGKIEILSGLDGTEIIATDGAGFLTDGTNIRIAK